jgi:hypothetical protein
MARTSRTQWRPLSRRTVVIRSLACAAGAAASLAPVKEASAKMAQKAVDYQDTPKGDQQCSNCSLFRTPARWSTARSVRRAGVNSGSKRQAEPWWLPQPHAKRRGTPVVTASLGSHGPQSRTRTSKPCRLGFFQDDVGKHLLICVKAGLFERVYTVKAQGKGERS